MYPLLIASRDDICAMNMASYLIAQCGMKEEVYADYAERNITIYSCPYFALMLIDGSALEAEWIDEWLSERMRKRRGNEVNGTGDGSSSGRDDDGISRYINCYIFLSRHRSESNKPTLTSHSTGNFSHASMGGNARELAYTYPSLQKCYMLNLYSNRGKVPNYDIVIEATHHGPTSLAKPVLFIEIGSSEKEWSDMDAVSVTCHSLLASIVNFKEYSKKVGVALGGTHYPEKFTNLLIDSDIALASVASKHNLKHIDESMLRQMIAKSIEPVRYIILDWKGLGGEKDRIVNLVSSVEGVEVIKV
ncbi:MAG: D-aminoacyl-tRNA deacylase [Candidatus Nitrosocaldus sp.]